MVSSLFLQLLYNYCIDINIYSEDSTGNTKSNWDKEICSAVRADHQTEAMKSVRQGGNKISSHPAGRFSVVATIPADRAAFLQTRCAATVTGPHLFLYRRNSRQSLFIMPHIRRFNRNLANMM